MSKRVLSSSENSRRDDGMKRIYLSLGSNLGNPVAAIQRALDLLPEAGVKILRVSSFYRSEPVDFTAQPWFANCVAEGETILPPSDLLAALQRIECRLGRRRGIPKGPRAIDIDLLLYEDLVIHSPALRIPHERMADRRFVLIPFCEIAPDVQHPVTHRTVLEMAQETTDRSQVIPIRNS